MIVHYRCILGRWQYLIWPWKYDWQGLDCRGESYWMVPGTEQG